MWPREWVVIALLFHDRGTRRGWWVVSSTPRPHFTPGKDPVPTLQEARWAPGPVWTGGKSRPHRDSIPDHPSRSQALYRLSYPAHILCSKFLPFSLGPNPVHEGDKGVWSALLRGCFSFRGRSHRCPLNGGLYICPRAGLDALNVGKKSLCWTSNHSYWVVPPLAKLLLSPIRVTGPWQDIGSSQSLIIALLYWVS